MSSLTSTNNPRLFPEGGRIVIIGGGPGGTACALALRKFASKKNIKVKITLVESKDFTHKNHSNQCVGVLSPPLPTLLEKTLGIAFPRTICTGNIERYILHSNGNEITLDDEGELSIAVSRMQFDAYMLEQVVENNIPVIPSRVVDLEFHKKNVIVFTENGSIEADVVVGAFGLDEGSIAIFKRQSPYRPPLSIDSFVTNFPISDDYLRKYSECIHAYLPKNPKIEFGAVTPKCDHLTINIAGRKVDPSLLYSFLENSEVNGILPVIEDLENYIRNKLILSKGRFPRTIARNYYGDRYVMVGDASGLVRVFKGKGATTAMLTGIRAADTIINYGISRQAFHQNYRKANQDIIQDLPYGRLMRLATFLMSTSGFMGLILRAAEKTPELRSALFGAVSGHTAFRDILSEVLRPKIIHSILLAIKK
jgi:flavin-dependent dehydrogenase